MYSLVGPRTPQAGSLNAQAGPRWQEWTQWQTEFLRILQLFVPLLKLLPCYPLTLNNIRVAGQGNGGPYDAFGQATESERLIEEERKVQLLAAYFRDKRIECEDGASGRETGGGRWGGGGAGRKC